MAFPSEARWRNGLAALAAAALLGFTTGQAPAQETPYSPIPDPREIPTPPAPPEPETAYNPAGTESPLPVGLISFRRGEPGHQGFLLGMQQAVLAREEKPLNVAPLDAETPEEQLEVLRRRGVTTFLLDAPDANEARDFLQKTQPLALQTVLITARAPDWRTPPLVLNSPALLAQRAGVEAIRVTGNEEVPVAYVAPGPEDNLQGARPEDVERLFLQDFRGAAPKVELIRLDPEQEEAETDAPVAVCLLTEALTEKWMKAVRERFPDAVLIGTGESPAVMEAVEEGILDVRIRPDYQHLYEAARREAAHRSEFPAIAASAADRLAKEEETSNE